MEGPIVVEHAADWLRKAGVLATIRYSPPHALHDAAEAILSGEMRDSWSKFLSPRLQDEAYTRRCVEGSTRWRTIDVSRIENVIELTPTELVGFCEGTSYGSAYVASLTRPTEYLDDLRERLERASEWRAIPMDFGIEIILARRGE
jgi:hypothetical protein